MEKCWGEFGSPWRYFFTKNKQKDATCMVQIHEVAKKHFLLEKEPVLRKKGSGGEVERRRGAR